MLDIDDFLVDPRKRTEGVFYDLAAWLNNKDVAVVPDDGTDAAIRIASWDSEGFQITLSEVAGGIPPDADNATEQEKEANRVTRNNAYDIAMARKLVTGWRAIVRTGAEIPYSESATLSLIKDAKFPQFRELIFVASHKHSFYRWKSEDKRLGN